MIHSDPQSILTARFANAIGKAFGDAHASTDPLIRAAANPQFGDYQANAAMSLAKALGQKPRDVAQKIVDNLKWDDVLSKKPEIAGPGFINLTLSPAFIESLLKVAAVDSRLGVAVTDKPLRTVVDYSGPNVAKEMHVGHLRSTGIGDTLARVLEFAGHTVIRQNHMGDWGTAFGMLTQHGIDNGWKDTVTTEKIGDLNVFYQAAKKRFDAEPEFAGRARLRVVKLQSGDPETIAIWKKLIDVSKLSFNEVYARLNITLTDADIRAESFYNPLLSGVVEELLSLGIATVSEGAACVFLPGYLNEEGKPSPLIIRKSDGGFGYATTDLAAVRYRATQLKADRMLYVTDARQKQHFKMVFETAAKAGWTQNTRIEHVAFGQVLGEDHKPFKTRSGDTVKLVDLLDEAEARALAVIAEKNPELSEAERAHVARVIGIGAVKYADQCNDLIKDYVFDWNRMLAFDGNTAPYLQNAFVRVCSIFRRAALELPGLDRASALAFPILIMEPAERNLAIRLLRFSTAIDGVVQSLEPHRLCGYLYDLASAYHQFFENCPVLKAVDAATRQSRLALCALTAATLERGLGLLGIGVVERM